ncbi:SHQ1 protein-domain-containing protein [Mycena latifolia]|nr:SHQ1 protein-domain-containing protein [Mycena latifolia]
MRVKDKRGRQSPFNLAEFGSVIHLDSNHFHLANDYPRFECSQTPESVVIQIYCPSVRAADVEIHVDDTLFTVHINPYFLRLKFPHSILEYEASAARYDPSSGYLTVTLTKKSRGEEFADLDLLSNLLAPRPSQQTPLIELIGTEDADEADELVARTDALSLEREREQEKIWLATAPFQFTDDENLVLLNLPRKECTHAPLLTAHISSEPPDLIDGRQTKSLYLTLVSIIFSYAYETRTTLNGFTSESATPTTPSHTPSAANLTACLAQSYYRSLAFPLYRSFVLAEACRADVAALLLLETRTVLRVLLARQHVLAHHEVYYVYNKIWLEDFCVWVQASARDDTLRELGAAVRGMRIPKSAIGWDLEGLEAAMREVQARESDSDESDEAEVARQL